MVFFNYATMQMAAKIVYYGPGLCGKTTNLHHIYGRTAPGSRGEMVSLETETDRTLFFDLLPLDVGVVGGFKTRVQLYTVPGQVFYNTTRKLVLKGVDGIVFVADSQKAMRDANVESVVNLRTNLAEIGLNLDDLPMVYQYNKRDLPNILTLQELEESLNPDRKHESYEACAVVGQGVFETLKAISKITLLSVRKKMLGEQRTARPAPLAGTTGSSIWPAAARETPAAVGKMPVSGSPGAEKTPPPSAPPEAVAASPMPEPASRGFEEPATVEVPQAPAAAESPEIGEVTFPQTPAMEVKHVRVRSNIDILAELDKLRRNATSVPSPDRAVRRAAAEMSIDDLLANSLNHRKEINRVFEVRVPQAELARGHTMRVGMELEDAQNNPVGERKSFSIPLNTKADVEKLLLSLKFHILTK
jgi:signal recognition particle receptor subunit beta